MSELTKLSRDIKQAIQSIDNFRRTYTNGEPFTAISRISFTRDLLHTNDEISANLKPRLQSLLAKRSMLDPITGAPRFGPATQNKLNQIEGEFSILLSDCQELVHKLSAFHQNHEIDSGVEDDGQNILDLALLKLRHAITARPMALEVSAATDNEAKPAEKNSLHEKAEYIRKKKQSEAQNVALIYRENLLAARQIFSALNKMLSNRLSDVEQIVTYIECATDQRSNPEQASPKTTALKMVIDILDRIISRPDDASFRRIKVSHPIVKERIGDIPGGIELLLAVGFQLKVLEGGNDSSGNDPFVDSELVRQSPVYNHSAKEAFLGRVLTSDSICAPVSVCIGMGRNIYNLLSPYSEWDAVLEMHEPSTSVTLSGISGKSEWLEWFDALTAKRDYLKTQPY